MFNVRYEKTSLQDVLFITFDRYGDERGFFSETLRISDLSFIDNLEIVQINESLSAGNVIRGLHFQWDPYMGKLVRAEQGEFYDLMVDIRQGSPTYGKGNIIKLVRDLGSKEDHLIWLPPGIAHGFFCLEKCMIGYYCTGEYNGSSESNISPLAPDIDWSMADSKLVKMFKEMQKDAIITDKDRNGNTLASWANLEQSNKFMYNE